MSDRPATSGGGRDRTRVLVDGIIYGMQPRGGVSRVFTELLPRIAKAGATRVLLHVPPVCLQPPPAGAGMTILRDWAVRPWRLRPAVNAARRDIQIAANTALTYTDPANADKRRLMKLPPNMPYNPGLGAPSA